MDGLILRTIWGVRENESRVLLNPPLLAEQFTEHTGKKMVLYKKKKKMEKCVFGDNSDVLFLHPFAF